MFNALALKNILKLLQVFSKKDRRYKLPMRSWEDFKDFPVSGRLDLKRFIQQGLEDIPFNVTATSGSTSSRMMIAHSFKAYETHLRRLVKIYQYVGVKKGVLCLNLCSYELNSGGRMMEAAFKQAGAGVIPMGPINSYEKFLEAIQLIKVLKPNMINAYTNQLYDLFAQLGRNHSIRKCLVNGEPLWHEYRKRVEQMGGVDIHDHYGAMEVSGLAIAVRPDDEYMRVVADGLLFEVLGDSGEISSLGMGDLLVTDLYNTSMPFIRYRIGDRVELRRHKGVFWIKILGRTEDSILINGVVVQKSELIRLVNDFLGHPAFFFVVDKHPVQYYDRLIINITRGSVKQLLAKNVRSLLGIDNCIDLRIYKGIIPRTLNGKTKYFIDARTKA